MAACKQRSRFREPPLPVFPIYRVRNDFRRRTMTQPSRILWLGVFAATLLLPSRLIPQARSKGSLQVTSQRSRTTPSASSRSLIASANGSLDQSKARLMNSYGRLPLSFEANRGQADARVKFQSQAGGHNLFSTEPRCAGFVFP